MAVMISVFMLAGLAVPSTVASALAIGNSDLINGLLDGLMGDTGGNGLDLMEILSNGTILTGLIKGVRDKLTTMNVDLSGISDDDITGALWTAVQNMDTVTALSEGAKLISGGNSSTLIGMVVDILASANPPMTTDPTEPTAYPTQSYPGYDPGYNYYTPSDGEEPGTVGTDTTQAASPISGVDYSGYTLPTSVYVPPEESTLTEAPTYDVVPPSTQYTALVTAAPYEANVMDEQGGGLAGSSSATKVVLGVALITISLGAVIGVGVMLRKTKA